LDWKKLELGKIIELKYGKGLSKKQRVKGEFPVYGSGGIIDFHESPLLKGPNIIVGRKGSIGTVYYEEKNCFPIDTVFYVELKDDNTHLKFVYPLLKNLNLARLGADAAVPGLNRNTALKQEVRIPDLSTQRKIASVLSAYDNLIENNTRRIQILEEMAQRIYKEWFVDFKYPGHENDKLVDSELGMIPEGWEVRKSAEVFRILGGGTPSTKVPEYWENGTINWYSPKDLTKSNSMFALRSGSQISDLGLQKSSAKLFPAFSVMLTSRATIGVVSINTTEACTNQGFISCIPSEHMSTYQIYYWLLNNIKMFLAHSSGATFKELTKTTFKKFDLVVSSKNISTSFNELVAPFTDEILILQKKQENLRQTRDFLLPKLISGKVDVSNLDIDTSILND
jgi:type I restriction enzyme, S subunit